MLLQPPCYHVTSCHSEQLLFHVEKAGSSAFPNSITQDQHLHKRLFLFPRLLPRLSAKGSEWAAGVWGPGVRLWDMRRGENIRGVTVCCVSAVAHWWTLKDTEGLFPVLETHTQTHKHTLFGHQQLSSAGRFTHVLGMCLMRSLNIPLSFRLYKWFVYLQIVPHQFNLLSFSAAG